MEPNIPLPISILFICLVFGLLFLITLGYKTALIRSGADEATRRKKIRRFLIVALFWLMFLTKISEMHFFHDWSAMPPRIALAALPPLIFAIVLVKSKKLEPIIEYIPQSWIVSIQSFRIVMEFILWWLFLENIIPQQMTLEGRNFDILSGITALIVAYLIAKKKISNKGLIAWNFFGLALLLNIFIVAVLSTPFPFRVFMNEPANTMIAYFPFVWLPGFVVPVAYTMHFISLKKCLTEKR